VKVPQWKGSEALSWAFSKGTSMFSHSTWPATAERVQDEQVRVPLPQRADCQLQLLCERGCLRGVGAPVE